MPADFEFVPVEDGQGKPRGLRRDLIRRHCMRGRNTRVDSRRTQRKTRQSARKRQASQGEALPAAWPSDAAATLQNLPPAEKPPTQALTRCQAAWSNLPRATAPWTTSQGLDLRLWLVGYSSFPLEMCRPSLFHRAVRDWSRFLSLKKIVYPIESYVDLEREDLGGVSWLSHDECFFHSVQFSILAMEDFLRHRPAVSDTWSHLQRAIVLLNERLRLVDASLRQSTVYTVALLALSGSLCEDHAATKAHLLGLQKMVQLLGGLPYLNNNPLLRYKLSCLELVLYLDTGYHFPFQGAVSWTPIFPLPHDASDASGEIQLVRDLCEPKLAGVFHDLWVFVKVLNEHLAQCRPMDATAFQDQVDCIQARLLQSQPATCGTLDNSLWLGMLAFFAVTFGLPRGASSYAHLSCQLRQSLLKADLASSKLAEILFWVVILGCMTGLNADDPQLSKFRTRLTGHVMSWDDARRRLQSIMWIDGIHSDRGREAFTMLELRCSIVE